MTLISWCTTPLTWIKVELNLLSNWTRWGIQTNLFAITIAFQNIAITWLACFLAFTTRCSYFLCFDGMDWRRSSCLGFPIRFVLSSFWSLGFPIRFVLSSFWSLGLQPISYFIFLKRLKESEVLNTISSWFTISYLLTAAALVTKWIFRALNILSCRNPITIGNTLRLTRWNSILINALKAFRKWWTCGTFLNISFRR